MAIGALDSWYTSGSLYKRYKSTIGSSMNRRVVKAFDAQVASAGAAIFGQTTAQAEQLSVLAVQQMQQRVAGSFQSSMENAAKARSQAVNIFA